MLTDREQDQYAAKAAGIEIDHYRGDVAMIKRVNSRGREELVAWRPRVDDGDALRLAVKLGMKFGLTIDTGGMAHWGPVTYSDYRLQSNGHRYKYNGPMMTHGDDALAATRICIMRAAVLIASK